MNMPNPKPAPDTSFEDLTAEVVSILTDGEYRDSESLVCKLVGEVILYRAVRGEYPHDGDAQAIARRVRRVLSAPPPIQEETDEEEDDEGGVRFRDMTESERLYVEVIESGREPRFDPHFFTDMTAEQKAARIEEITS